MTLKMRPDKEVVVIGGSISGLMHALVLKSLGYNVCVLEARSEQEMQERAAGLSVWPYGQELLTTYADVADMNSIAITNPNMRVMTGSGELMMEMPISGRVVTSTWAIVKGVLQAACEKQVTGHGNVRFENGVQVSGIAEENEGLVVVSRDQDGVERNMLADLVIAADGARSLVRSKLLPSITPEYAGYLAWRGQTPEAEVPSELKEALNGTLCSFRFDGSYILIYMTPSESGSMEPGMRMVEWCCYDTCEAELSEFANFMTDIEGKRHNVTVPANLLSPAAWAAQIARRESNLSPLWREIFMKSKAPLLTVIRSFSNQRAAFFDGKLFLAGEAYMQIRPHLGASCDISALQALCLAKVLRMEMSIEEYEKEVATYAEAKAIGSLATGTFGMTGKWPEGFSPAFAKL